MTVLETQGLAARIAARQLAVTGTQEKNAALLAIADALISRRSEWLAANAADLHAARAGGLGAALLDRLALVDEIMAYDNGVVESLTAARQEVEDTLAALNESKAELDEQKRQLDIQYAEQAAKVSEAQALFNELANQAEEAQALVGIYPG